MPRNIRLVWHRKGDLRLDDNELYHLSTSSRSNQTRIVSLFVINPKDYAPRKMAIQNEGASDSSCSSHGSSLFSVTEGPHASMALISALTSLRRNLRRLGGDLILSRGDPLHIVPEIAGRLQAHEVSWSEVPGHYECQLSESMKNIFQQVQPQCIIKAVTGYTLWHPDDLPRGQEAWEKLARPKEPRSKKRNKNKSKATSTSSSHLGQSGRAECHAVTAFTVDISSQWWEGLPRIMGDFRRAARSAAAVRPCLPYPSLSIIQPWSAIVGHHDLHAGELPDLKELTAAYKSCSLFGMPAQVIDTVIDHAACHSKESELKIDEAAAHQHWYSFLHRYAATADRSLADTSNQQSAHISAFLAFGVLSPRQIYWSVVKHQQKYDEESSGCQWLINHMEMRDYFIYSAFAADRKLYHLHGQQPVHKSRKRREKNPRDQEPIRWKAPEENLDQFIRWATGQTGLPLVDAGMRELMTTGYCSNRVRQNMASVLTKDLCMDWRIGAEWFQFCLEDHCVAANWGNWQYFGGVGGDPKNRHFRTVSQARRYDPTSSYVKKWLPKLRAVQNVSNEVYFRPWDFLGNWSDTIVNPLTQYTWQDRQLLQAAGNQNLNFICECEINGRHEPPPTC